MWVVVCGLMLCGSGLAQENGVWRAASTSAKSITGDVQFSGEKLYINYSGFIIAQLHSLSPSEAAAVFDADSNAPVIGNVYRTDIPATKKFLHHNQLCGSEDTQYIVTYVNGHELQMAFFSGAAMPTLTAEALTSSQNLCGTFVYERE